MASPFDLVILAQAQSFISAGASDTTVLPALITQISRAILSDLQRPSILPTAYTETRDGGGESEIALRNWPVISIASLAIDGAPISASPPLVANQSWQTGYVLEADSGMPPGRMQMLSLRGRRFCDGRQNVSVAYTAGYQIAAEPATVPASPYTVTPLQPYGAWGSDAGVTYAGGSILTKVSSAPGVGQYAVSNSGVYTFAAADVGASVLITYGYVPADLANAALDWIADRYAYKDRVGARSKSLGGQETMSWNITSVPSFVDLMLQPYRRVFFP